MPVNQSDIVLIFVVSAVLVLSLSLVIILFVVFYQKRLIRQNEVLQKMEQERQQALLDASIQSQEVERKRIAKDLHDEVGAMLSIAKLHLGQAIRTGGEGNATSASLSEAKMVLEETIKNVRSISRDLLPSVLENFGLIVALGELVSRINAANLIEVNFVAEELSARIPLKKELALYRIAQELINNSIKHANAKAIEIVVEEKDNAICFQFTDDGKGLDPKEIANYVGLGLRNIDSRIKVIGAACSIVTSPGNGFKMELTVDRQKID